MMREKSHFLTLHTYLDVFASVFKCADKMFSSEKNVPMHRKRVLAAINTSHYYACVRRAIFYRKNIENCSSVNNYTANQKNCRCSLPCFWEQERRLNCAPYDGQVKKNCPLASSFPTSCTSSRFARLLNGANVVCVIRNTSTSLTCTHRVQDLIE